MQWQNILFLLFLLSAIHKLMHFFMNLFISTKIAIESKWLHSYCTLGFPIIINMTWSRFRVMIALIQLCNHCPPSTSRLPLIMSASHFHIAMIHLQTCFKDTFKHYHEKYLFISHKLSPRLKQSCITMRVLLIRDICSAMIQPYPIYFYGIHHNLFCFYFHNY